MTATMQKVERITTTPRTIDQAQHAPITPETTIVLRAPNGEETELPAELQKIIFATLNSIAGDNAITIGRMPDVLTSTVAADLLSVSRPTLMKWAREGEIDSLKVGTHTRFTREEVLRLRSLKAAQRADAFESLRAFDEKHEEELED